MTLKPPPPVWIAAGLGLLALVVLYAAPLATGFLNDDYFFLEAARTSLSESLSGLGPLGNYYRPLSRQIYFTLLAPLGGGNPLVFHAVNFAMFIAALLLLADLLRVLLPRAGVMAGLAFFALLPFQRVNLTWVSCAQDLLALTFVLGAIALHRRDRLIPAALMGVAAMACKESAWPVAGALLAWDVLVGRHPWRRALRRVLPAAVLAALWVTVATHMRMQGAAQDDFIRLSPVQFIAGYVHMLQAILGLDHPSGFIDAMISTGPDLVPLALLAALAWWVVREHNGDVAADAGRLPLLAITWLLLFGFAVGPVAHTWSSYYYTLAAVGAALLVGWTASRIGRTGWLVFVALLAWWHAGGTTVRAFAIEDRPWGWTSHLTSFYFERAARLTTTLSDQLVAIEKTPPANTRFFFALLPPWAGFQMGNGALIRRVYEDPSLESHFYSRFSEATSGTAPNRFLVWDGEALRPLYERNQSPYFRVGCDLLLLDEPSGAGHAFRRGLAAGESPRDIHYWLGWSELWSGNRSGAEAAWLAFGAQDDSVRWLQGVQQARQAMFERGDSLAARQHLLDCIRYGIGRPEAHAALGQLMRARGSRFGALELKVAASLDSRDWRSRIELLDGLVDARLDVQAEQVLSELKDIHPEWQSDSNIMRSVQKLRARSTTGAFAEFEKGKL